MSDQHESATPAQEMARKWQDLAERRRRHLLEMYRSGRWRRYYTEEQLMAQMRDAVRGIEHWSLLSGKSPVADNDNPPVPEAAE
jgi:uncharacterized repeat protein (TIGR03809 family)